MQIPMQVMMAVAMLHFASHSIILSAADKEDAPARASEQEVIRQLQSEEFSVREAATEHLTRNALQRWALIKRLAQHADPEISARARAVMVARADVLWERLAELSGAEEGGLKAFVQDVKVAFWKSRLECWSAESEKKVIALEADLKDKKKRLGKRELVAHEKKYRWQRYLHLTRRDQCRALLATGDYKKLTSDAYPKDWDPQFVPVLARRRLRISFEFVDTPLSEALLWMGKVTGLTCELQKSAKDAGGLKITLRVTDMDLQTALKWVCRLAELDAKDDPKDPSKILIGK